MKFMEGNAPTFAQRPPLNIFHFKKIHTKALSIKVLKYVVTEDNFAFLVLFTLRA